MSSPSFTATFERLLDRRIDGLLVAPADGESPLMLDAVGDGMPMVFVDRSIPGIDAPVVGADGRGAVHDLVARLCVVSHRRLAIIAVSAVTTIGRERVEAFRAALGEYGLALHETYVGQGNFQVDGGRRATEHFLDLSEPPEVVFAADNLMALGVLDAIRARRMWIPDGIAWFIHTDPPIAQLKETWAGLPSVLSSTAWRADPRHRRFCPLGSSCAARAASRLPSSKGAIGE